MYRAFFTGRLSDGDYEFYALVDLTHEHSEALLEVLTKLDDYKTEDYTKEELSTMPDILSGEE